MDDFLKQDIFFFVATVSVLILTVMMGVVLVYVIRITRKIDHILAKVRTETDIISEELGELRRNVRKEGIKFKHLARFFNNVRKGK